MVPSGSATAEKMTSSVKKTYQIRETPLERRAIWSTWTGSLRYLIRERPGSSRVFSSLEHELTW